MKKMSGMKTMTCTRVEKGAFFRKSLIFSMTMIKMITFLSRRILIKQTQSQSEKAINARTSKTKKTTRNAKKCSNRNTTTTLTLKVMKLKKTLQTKTT